MPEYLNDTEAAITSPEGMGTWAAGAAKYLPKYLKDSGSLTVTQYVNPTNGEGGAPMDKLHAAALGAGVTKTGLAKYKLLKIKNNSGAIINCVFNEDADNAYVLLSTEIEEITQDREIDKVVITGAGEGAVYVYGRK